MGKEKAGKRGTMGSEEMLELIKKASEVSELHHVTTFKGSRKDKGGVVRDLTIEILDMGVEEPDRRYKATATDSGGRVATGNAGPTVERALAAVRWPDLDAPTQMR